MHEGATDAPSAAVKERIDLRSPARRVALIGAHAQAQFNAGAQTLAGNMVRVRTHTAFISDALYIPRPQTQPFASIFTSSGSSQRVQTVAPRVPAYVPLPQRKHGVLGSASWSAVPAVRFALS